MGVAAGVLVLEESQHNTCPSVMHIPRWAQVSPRSRHGEDPPDYPEGSARDETPVGQDAGGEDTGGGNGALPFTGPNDTVLPAGAALLAAGGLLVGATRYRARHARR